ncbi:hypothetical protein UPYG_G00043110, partial [Umbra pygmaea]
PTVRDLDDLKSRWSGFTQFAFITNYLKRYNSVTIAIILPSTLLRAAALRFVTLASEVYGQSSEARGAGLGTEPQEMSSSPPQKTAMAGLFGELFRAEEQTELFSQIIEKEVS